MTRKRTAGPRACAARLLVRFFSKHESLTSVLAAGTGIDMLESRDKALCQALVYGVVRWQIRLDAILSSLMPKPLRRRDLDIQAVLWIGLFQLIHMRVPDHAVVSKTVATVVELGKPWAKGLVNATLRSFLRDHDAIMSSTAGDLSIRFAYPSWLGELFHRQFSDDLHEILEAGNQLPPMSLRINEAQTSRDGYLALLKDAGIAAKAGEVVDSAVTLDRPVNVDLLPGFSDGVVSVQDEAAQLAAQLLEPESGQRILDACAAPGGKCCHILELLGGEGGLLALDHDEKRLSLVADNLKRLHLQGEVRCADAGDIESWWDGVLFDRILLDAPCSGTGVIRRHPDIRHLRKPADIVSLVGVQAHLLDALWDTLKPGGMLLYVTCSILQQENEDQIGSFLERHYDVRPCLPEGDWGEAWGQGRQILPGRSGMDGFYYARLCKLAH